MPDRRPNARKVGPDYLLRLMCRTTGHEPGAFYIGRHEDTGEPLFGPDQAAALRMRGAGLASAVLALARQGFAVERVLA